MRALVFAVALLITGTAHAQLARTTIRPGGLSRTLPAQGVDDGTVFRASFATPGCHASPVADTGQPISVVRASAATVVIGGELVTCAPGELRVNEHGALIEPGRTNYMLNSAAPADQSVTLSAGAHCAWTDGGSVEVTAGTATVTGLPCSPTAQCQCPFTVSTGGTVSVAFSGGPTRAQVENGAYRTSFIATGPTAATRQADNVSLPKPPSVAFADQHALRAYVRLLGIGGSQIAIGSNQNYSPYLRVAAGANSPVAYHSDNATGSTAQLSPPAQMSDAIKIAGDAFRAGRLTTGALFIERAGHDSTLAGSSALVTEPTTIFIGSHNAGSHLGGYIRDVCVSRRATGCPL